MARNSWREMVLDEYRCAREAWELQREASCLGYATEEAEYGPGPTFRQFLIEFARANIAVDVLPVFAPARFSL